MPLDYPQTVFIGGDYYLKSMVPKSCTSKASITLLLMPILGPTQDDNVNWKTFTKFCCHYTEHARREVQEAPLHHQEEMNLVFANCSEEDVIYPLKVKEIAQAQTTDATLKKLSKHDKYSTL
eukprot:CCRYP_013473-RA/>CCRYP_013473-RA protein AED:0.30 eAED:0.53 QI:0/0/0/1/0/0/2/0/121